MVWYTINYVGNRNSHDFLNCVVVWLTGNGENGGNEFFENWHSHKIWEFIHPAPLTPVEEKNKGCGEKCPKGYVFGTQALS